MDISKLILESPNNNKKEITAKGIEYTTVSEDLWSAEATGLYIKREVFYQWITLSLSNPLT